MNDKLIKILISLSLIVLIVSAVSTVGAVDPQMEWYRSIGSIGSNEVAYSVLLAEDGGYVFAGSKSTPSNGLDFYIVKTSQDGTVVWEKTYGGYADDSAYSMARSGDGGYVLAGYTKSFGAGGSDVMLLKVDADGAQDWFMTFGGVRDDVGQSISPTAGGGFIIAGGTRSFDPLGSYDAYLIAIGSSGNLLWSKAFGGTDYDYANDVQQTADGGFIVAGGTGIFLSYVRDALLIKTDASGNAQWTKTFGGAGPDNALSVIQAEDGGYLLAGGTRSYGAGGEDAYLVKTDSAGALVWQNFFGSSGEERANSVIQTSDGDFLFIGFTGSYGAGLTDAYMVKVNAAGSLGTMKTFGGINEDIGRDIIQLSDGSCVLAGETKSYAGSPSLDAYLVKTNIFIDFLPPQIVGANPGSGDLVVDPLQTISASFYDISGVDTASVSVALDSSDITASCAITSDGFSYTPPSPLGEGTHTVSVAATDSEGNSGTSSWSFVVDSLAPSVSALTPANHSSINATRPLISASFEDAVGVDVGGVVAQLDGTDITSLAVITGSGIQYVPASPLSQGLHTVSLTVQDEAGNTAIVSWTFRTDETPPVFSSVSPTEGANIYAFGGGSVTISASYSDNAGIDTGAIRLTLDGVDITSKATVTATGLSYTGEVGPGAHTARITIADGAGNVGTRTVNFTVANLMPFLIIGVIALIIVAVVLLLLSRRRKPKGKAAVPKWEQPPPPPPPMETYIPEVEREEIPVERPPAQPPPPLPVEKPAEPPTEEKAPTAETVEEVPTPPPQPPVMTAAEEPAPAAPPSPAIAPEKITCPACGATNKPDSTKCWYCDKPFA